MDKTKEILSIIIMSFFLLFGIYLSIIGFQDNDTKNIVIGLSILFGGLSLVLLYFWFDLTEQLRKKKIIKLIKCYESKSNKTSFDFLMLDILKEKVSIKLIQYFKNKSKSKPYEMYSDYKNKEGLIGYYYRDFNIEIKIKVNGIIVTINSPQKYDYVKKIEELEKERLIPINFNELTTEDVYRFIVSQMQENNKLIQDFLSISKPNNHINGKTVSKVENHLSEKKLLAIITLLFGLLLTFLGGAFTYKCAINDKQWIAGSPIMAWGLSLSFLVIGIISLFSSFKMFTKVILFKKDKKLLRSINVIGTCVKVKLYFDGAYRSHDIILKTITTYLKTEKRIEKAIIIIDQRFKATSFNIKKIKRSLLNQKYDLHCLMYSRYVLTGSAKILSKIK